MAVAAKGARIFDEAGLDYIDASSGPLAVALGHGHPRVLAALADQFNAVDYVHRTHFRNSAAGRGRAGAASGPGRGRVPPMEPLSTSRKFSMSEKLTPAMPFLRC